ncbi:MAG: helix-turn-helix transcriptional regulator [Pirellulaceae bacterium]
MIRNESEYQESALRLRDEAARLKQQQAKLQELGLGRDEIKRAMDPLRSFHEQLKEEVASFERLKRGEFDEVHNFEGLGRLLIALRIAQGLSQRELAGRLGTHESQVSRDERNEYHGITLERAGRILDSLNVELESIVKSIGKKRERELIDTITV